jgi:beta-glucosidase
MRSLFSRNFLWGVATAAYQVEGAVREGNRGLSIWDTFSHTPGRTYMGHTGDVACNHYHLYLHDIALMSQIGVNAYRFSIAWPRIIPDGSGPTNPAGVDWYSRLVDALLEVGITPVATLYHWDLPQTLEDRGGWRNRETADYFADYAARVVDLLGDRVYLWITLNEPQVVAEAGHLSGIHAPGIRDRQAAITASHVLNLAHAKAVTAMRAINRNNNFKVGITLNLSKVYPADPTNPDDVLSAEFVDARSNGWYLEPVFNKRYPEQVLERYASNFLLPRLDTGDFDILSPPIDFLGINNYTRIVVRAVKPGEPWKCETVRPTGSTYTEMGWEVAPDGLRDILLQVHEKYHPREIMVTENGAAFDDRIDNDGKVNDDKRVEYLRSYIASAAEAIKAGVPLTGYFVWSFLDNFEWQHGYSKRFGIVYVDYRTQRRIIKKSGYWYQKWIASLK